MITALYPWQTALPKKISGTRALLLHGPEGIGKTVLARALAEKHLCRRDQPHACGECEECQLLAAGHHPDLCVVAPEAGQSTLRIDQIRALHEKLSKTPVRAERQVVLLYPAEAMRPAAANALLKTLEEPPGHVLMLLVSHRLAQLPPTLRSRCQQRRVPLPPATQSIAWLAKQRPDRSPGDLQMFLALADQRPLTALAYADALPPSLSQGALLDPHRPEYATMAPDLLCEVLLHGVVQLLRNGSHPGCPPTAPFQGGRAAPKGHDLYSIYRHLIENKRLYSYSALSDTHRRTLLRALL